MFKFFFFLEFKEIGFQNLDANFDQTKIGILL